jgi:hypothetical protein
MSDDTTSRDDTTTRIIIPTPSDLLRRIEDYRFANRIPSRAAAVRELLELALATKENRHAST